MVSRITKKSAPLTFDLPLDLIARIAALQKSRGLRNASEVIRLAVDHFDFAGCNPAREPHRQISVRVAVTQRALLKRQARAKDVSVGELLRLALEALPARAPRGAKRG